MQISSTLKRAIDSSAKFAKSVGAGNFETEHLLFGILLEKQEKSVKLLESYGVNAENYKNIYLKLFKSSTASKSVEYSAELNNFFTNAVLICERNGKSELGINEVLYLMTTHSEFKATKMISDYYKLNLSNLKSKFEKIAGFSVSENKSIEKNTKNENFDLS